MSRRQERINELLREEISQLIAQQIRDPRLSGVISITDVRVSTDLRNAKVMVSVLGDQATQQNALEGIQSAAAFLRKELKERVTLRYIPFLSFALDTSIEQADRVLRVMDRIQAAPSATAPSSQEA